MKSYVKIMLTLILCIGVSVGSQGQVQTVNEGFEVWPASGWETYILGAGNGWVQDWQGISYEGEKSALTAINNSQCDSWLVSPQVSIGTDNYVLNFWDYNLSPEFYDRTSVHVSVGSPNPEMGDFVEVYLSEDVSEQWIERTIDLSEYVGQNIYVGFQHEGTWHAWLIDKVSIAPLEYIDVAINSIVNPTGSGTSLGEQDVTINLVNFGSNSIDELVVNWAVNGEPQSPYTDNTLGLESGNNIDLSIGSYDFDQSGYYEISVTSVVDGDEIAENNTASTVYSISNEKDLRLNRVKPEGMYPSAGDQDVWIEIENIGEFVIDTLQVYWNVDGEIQETYEESSLDLAPGAVVQIMIGEYSFASGISEIQVETNALGDIGQEDNFYLAYVAVDTLWESFEGFDFPPNNWSIVFGVRDNINLGVPRHGNYFYSSSPDNNYFGEVSDTLYSPFLEIEVGDVYTIHLQTSDFLDAIHHLVAKDMSGNVEVIQEMNVEPNSWVELEMDLSSVAGVKRIGVVSSVVEGPGLTKFDLFTSTASLYQFQQDLKLLEGDMDIVAPIGAEQVYSCVVKNEGPSAIIGNEYTVSIVNDSGTTLASVPGQIISPQEEILFQLEYTFQELGEAELHFEISIDGDQNPSNNVSWNYAVHAVPSSAVIDPMGSKDFLSLNLPFNANGNTNSLGQDDISQTLYTSEQFSTVGYAYGMIYSYNNILNIEEEKEIPLQVWAQQMDQSNLNDGFIPTSELTLLFDDTLVFLPGERDIYIPFNAPFAINGIDNVVVQNFQYDPAWPPAIFNFWNSDMPNDGTVRSVAILDGYQIDPDQEFDLYASMKDIPFSRFVIDPVFEFGQISGYVTSSTDSSPIEGAEVKILNTSVLTYTDSDGYYILPEMPYGNYQVQVEKFGFDEVTSPVEIDAEDVLVDFVLQPLSQISVIGTVYGSNNTLTGLEGVEISLGGYSTGQLSSNSDGTFEFTELYSNSDYSINCSFYGYEDLNLYFTTSESDIDLGDLILNQIHLSPFNVEATLYESGVSVQWENPQSSQIEIVQNDLGFCSFSYTNEPNENVWLGNILEVNEILTLTDLEFRADIYENAVDFVTLEVLDLEGNVLSASDPILVYADSTYVVDIPNIVVYENVFVAVHWQDNQASTNALCIDFSNENIPNTAAIKYPDQDIVLLSDFFGGGPNLSFLIRAHTLNFGSNLSNGEELTYNVYRGLASEFPDFSNWSQINQFPISELETLDSEWDIFGNNVDIRYAVETIYSLGYSEVTFSNTVNGNTLGTDEWIGAGIHVAVFPNPATEVLNLSVDTDVITACQIEIFNSSGKLIYMDEMSKRLSINIQDFTTGIYFVRFNLNGLILSKKFVVSE